MSDNTVEFKKSETVRIEDALLRAASTAVERTAIVAGQQKICYGELVERVNGFSQHLLSHGLATGDRVALYQDKTIEAVIALYGTWMAGGVAVPVNEGLRRPQVLHILNTAECRFFVTDRRHDKVLSSSDLTDVQVIKVSTVKVKFQNFPPRQLSGGDTPAAILFTSGSTGRPKGILISHANLCAGSEIVTGYLGIQPEDRILSVLPFSFDYGLNQLLGAIHRSACCVLQRSPLPADLCRSLIENEISVLAGVPPLFVQLMSDLSPFREVDFPALRILTNTGGVFPAELINRYQAKLPKVAIILMYGFSESFRSTYLPYSELNRRPNSMGRAIPGCSIFVVDEHGKECATGEVGELIHQGPTVALGYWQAPEETEKVFRPDPIDPMRKELVAYSGDLVRRDEQGFLYFVGRRDQMFKSMGYRISPEDVEEQLLASNLLSEVVVGSQPDEVAGSRVIAHIVPIALSTFDTDLLLDHCRRYMPSYMIPVKIHVHASLPRLGSGKFDRKKLLA